MSGKGFGLLWDVCQNKHKGNPESVEAFESTTPEARDRARQKVLQYIIEAGEYGRTADEVEAAGILWRQSASARMSEMKRDGYLVPAGERRRTRTGRWAQPWKAPTV